MQWVRAAAVAVLFGAVAAAGTGTTAETEPDGFTIPPPQPVGVLGAAGISIAGTLDPTSPSGLDPGDNDGFSFTVAADGPFRAVVDDGAGATFVLALSEEGTGGASLLATVLGPAPLTISRPLLKAGTVYRVGVAALGDGSPLSYTLDLFPENAVPPWTGETCGGPVPEAEPDDDIARSTWLGWFDRTLCGEGAVAVVSPVDSGIDGDADFFRFRNVLPVPSRLYLSADPGLVDVEVDQLYFVGPAPIASTFFGSETTLDLPVLEPGADYMIRISARIGVEPVHYSFHLEPVAPPPPPPADPLVLQGALLRMGPDPARSRFTLRASFELGLGGGLGDGTAATLLLRGGKAELASGKLALDRKGRLRWKAPAGFDGIRSFTFDAWNGKLVVGGRGLDLAGGVDPGDPTVAVQLDLDDLRLAGSAAGKFRQGGRVLAVK